MPVNRGVTNWGLAKAADYSKRGEGCGLFPEKMEKEKEKRELRSPDGTEPDVAASEVRDAETDALRATAEVGVVAPTAAAQQTKRARLGSCGVCHAC